MVALVRKAWRVLGKAWDWIAGFVYEMTPVLSIIVMALLMVAIAHKNGIL